jgi:hypothetical protein
MKRPANFDPDSPWPAAARYCNDMAEMFGVEATLERLGIDVPTYLYLAEQRALRTVLVSSGRTAEAMSDTIEPVALRLDEQAALVMFQAAVMDALAIGWKARELADEASKEGGEE